MDKKEKRLKFGFVGCPIKDWIFFEHFFLIPTIGTFDSCTYHYGDRWNDTRVYALYIFWWTFYIDWKHRPVKDAD